MLNIGFSQNWFNKSYFIELTDVKSLDDLNKFSFHAIEGSRTENHRVSVDTSNLSIQFSFLTMGGEDATLVIENDGRRMTVMYGKYYPDVSRGTSQWITKGKFREGFYTSFDGFFFEVEEKYKDWWLISHQHSETESLSFGELEFDKFLKVVFAHENDTIIEIDSLISYRIKFATSQELNFAIPINSFVDTEKLICNQNVSKFNDSIIRLDFFSTDTSFMGTTTLFEIVDSTPDLRYFSFQKLGMDGKPYNGNASFFHDANYTNVFSFDNGNYLIICERRFGPDTRGSMPPGTSISYFLERI